MIEATEIQAAPPREDLVNLFHLLQAAGRIVRHAGEEVFDEVNRNSDVADYLSQLAHQVDKRFEVLPR